MTQAGKSMPLDASPHEDGNVFLEGGVCTVLGKEAAGMARIAGRRLYKTHFATCPMAKDFQRGRGA